MNTAPTGGGAGPTPTGCVQRPSPSLVREVHVVDDLLDAIGAQFQFRFVLLAQTADDHLLHGAQDLTHRHHLRFYVPFAQNSASVIVMMPRSAGEGFAGAVVFACGGGVCAKLTELIGKMNVELHSFRPKAFLDAQAALQVREHEAASIHQQDSSSMVFGIMATSGPSSFDQK